eukprot:scaffold47917_cov32-Tisochrysis_lutea.AAC.3
MREGDRRTRRRVDRPSEARLIGGPGGGLIGRAKRASYLGRSRQGALPLARPATTAVPDGALRTREPECVSGLALAKADRVTI